MNALERKLWPYQPRLAIVATLVILIVLLVATAVSRSMTSWPGQESERLVLVGIFILSVVPLVLVLVDTMSERGGSLEYRGLTINFSQVQRLNAAEPTIPANIGVPGRPVGDGGTADILDALRQATASESVIIDLEAGQAWWETRLLVLLVGALRHNKPKVVAFVGTDGAKRNCFQGWATVVDLLPHLLKAHPKYTLIYHTALAAARQWELVEPQGPNTHPLLPEWMQQPNQEDGPENNPRLAEKHRWMPFDHNSGLPNTFYAEQLLASELGEKIEEEEPPRTISLVRLEALFRPVLHRKYIDRSWPSERQLETFFENDAPYIAVTDNGSFQSLVSRLTVLNSMMGTLVQIK